MPRSQKAWPLSTTTSCRRCAWPATRASLRRAGVPLSRVGTPGWPPTHRSASSSAHCMQRVEVRFLRDLYTAQGTPRAIVEGSAPQELDGVDGGGQREPGELG